MLFANQQWTDARSQLQSAAHDYSNPQEYGILGELGVCAAVLGDTATAVSIADSLGRITGLLRPNAIYWKAIVLARLRRRAEAVALLNQAYAMGWPKASPFGHSLRQRFPDLFGYRPFEEFYKSD
jgi:hypothetical protein